MAARWAEVLGLPAPRRSEAASTLALSPGAIRFVPITDGRGEGVSAFGVAATDAGRALAAARARGLATAGRSLSIGGGRVGLGEGRQMKEGPPVPSRGRPGPARDRAGAENTTPAAHPTA